MEIDNDHSLFLLIKAQLPAPLCQGKLNLLTQKKIDRWISVVLAILHLPILTKIQVSQAAARAPVLRLHPPKVWKGIHNPSLGFWALTTSSTLNFFIRAALI